LTRNETNYLSGLPHNHKLIDKLVGEKNKVYIGTKKKEIRAYKKERKQFIVV